MPSVNLQYRLKDDTKFQFLIGRAFRAPTFNDLYWPKTGSEEGNPNLEPEKGISGEFGIEKRFSKFFKIGLTYFRSDYNNLIKWQKDSDNIWRPKNISSVIINGVEQEYQIKLFDHLNIDVAYTYLSAKDDKTHQYLTYQPKHKASLSLAYNGISDFDLGLKGRFVERSFDNAANSIYVKRFFVLDFNLSKKLRSGITCFISLNNLLHKKYQIRRNYPLPGFSLTSGIKLEF